MAKKEKAPLQSIRDRVKAFRRVKASELRANPRNWRTHPEEQRSALAGVLREVGIAGALVAYETPEGLTLIDGHLRQDAAPDSEWPVLILDVDEAEANKLLAVIDPIAAMAEADVEMYADLLGGIESQDDEFLSLIQSLQPTPPPVDDAADIHEDEIPPPPTKTITNPGDIWLMGDHRLLCGDSTNKDRVQAFMGGDMAHLVVTDPPYNVNYVGGSGLTIQNDNMDDQSFADFIHRAYAAAINVTIPGGGGLCVPCGHRGGVLSHGNGLGWLAFQAMPGLGEAFFRPEPSGLQLAARAHPVRMEARGRPPLVRGVRQVNCDRRWPGLRRDDEGRLGGSPRTNPSRIDCSPRGSPSEKRRPPNHEAGPLDRPADRQLQPARGCGFRSIRGQRIHADGLRADQTGVPDDRARPCLLRCHREQVGAVLWR